jgi:hypothetical protein
MNLLKVKNAYIHSLAQNKKGRGEEIPKRVEVQVFMKAQQQREMLEKILILKH